MPKGLRKDTLPKQRLPKVGMPKAPRKTAAKPALAPALPPALRITLIQLGNIQNENNGQFVGLQGPISEMTRLMLVKGGYLVELPHNTKTAFYYALTDMGWQASGLTKSTSTELPQDYKAWIIEIANFQNSHNQQPVGLKKPLSPHAMKMLAPFIREIKVGRKSVYELTDKGWAAAGIAKQEMVIGQKTDWREAFEKPTPEGYLKVLVATKETQGQRKNDFCFADEGELVQFSSECDREPVDGKCGCRRAMGGVTSHKASTTMKVAFWKGDHETYKAAIAAGLESGGWFSGMDKYAQDDWASHDASGLLSIASSFPEGTIVEKRGVKYQERIAK